VAASLAGPALSDDAKEEVTPPEDLMREHGVLDRALLGAMQSFITMYRPHAAREDTDLFPQLRDVVSSHEFDSMAEEFEKKEHELFGEDGFEKMAQKVAVLEMTMGIHDLNKFTPC
jgi:hemerythrin-like domain-containing protein